jgi:hypothetical protein
MKQFVWAGLALQLCALPAMAQIMPNSNVSVVPQGGGAVTPPAPATGMAQQGVAVPGANSFTESEARSRLEKNGFSGVSGLTKGDDGIWHGSAMKDGTSVQVSVDYKGNIQRN